MARSAEAAWTAEKWTATERANIKVVSDLLRAWEEKDADLLMSVLAGDALSRTGAHTPQPASNPETLREQAESFFARSSVKFKTLDTVAQGPIVVNTRIDRVTSSGDDVQDLYYLGVFFLVDGKIKEWNDYQVASPTPVKPGQPL